MGSNQDDDLDRAIRVRLQPALDSKGLCPSSETLNAYVHGLLDDQSGGEVRAHIDRCGLCDALLLRMEAFYTKPRWNSKWWAAAFAYAAVILLAIPAYRGLTRPEDRISTGPPPVEAPRGIDLDATRAGGAKVVQADESRHFFVQFYLPAKAGARYRAAIRKAGSPKSGEGIDLHSWDGQGNFLLLCRSENFGPGEYVVDIAEIDATGASPNQWSLPFMR